VAALDHPLRAEVQALRDIILAVDDRTTDPHLAAVDSDLLSGSWPDRRMAYFTDRADVEAKRAELERVLREIIRHNLPA
jgi:esterase/lipase superfamily enzyme